MDALKEEEIKTTIFSILASDSLEESKIAQINQIFDENKEIIPTILKNNPKITGQAARLKSNEGYKLTARIIENGGSFESPANILAEVINTYSKILVTSAKPGPLSKVDKSNLDKLYQTALINEPIGGKDIQNERKLMLSALGLGHKAKENLPKSNVLKAFFNSIKSLANR